MDGFHVNILLNLPLLELIGHQIVIKPIYICAAFENGSTDVIDWLQHERLVPIEPEHEVSLSCINSVASHLNSKYGSN